MAPTDVVGAWREALKADDGDRPASLSHPDVAMEGPRGTAWGLEVLKEWAGTANIRLGPLRRSGRDAETGEETGRATVATVFVISGGLVAGISRHGELEAALESAGLFPSDEKSKPEERRDVQSCTHLDQIRDVRPSADGCEECLQTGDTWVHLRECLVCGHVGCCDSSKNRHATKHFHATGHPLVRSFQPGEDWIWCYVDEVVMEPRR